MRRLFYLLHVAAVVASSPTKSGGGRRTSDVQQSDDTRTILFGASEYSGESYEASHLIPHDNTGISSALSEAGQYGVRGADDSMLEHSDIELTPDAKGGLASVPLSQAIPNPNDWRPQKFIPFDNFLELVKVVKHANYNHGAVMNASAFGEMRSHILTMYNGVGKVAHSFVLEAEHVDCIDIEKQPSVRIPKLDTIKSPPRPATAPKTHDEGGGGREHSTVDSPLKLGLKDAFGNAISCPEATIPFSRITLEKLIRFPTLSDFLAKTPDGARRTREPNDVQLIQEPHLYAFSYQYVNNAGGSSWLNTWAPVGDFSLSQQWYDAGSGSGTQTVEGGWVVYPNKFGTTSPVLFIFFTPNDYASGCYNLDCTGFVQTNRNWLLGGTLPPSVTGGTQNGIQMQWKLSNGGWWLYLTGSQGGAEAIGYYPTSLYNGGPLASNAVSVKYGGEVYRNSAGVNWPQMGSSVLPTGGFGYSAFQNKIYYVPQGGGSVWANLVGNIIGLPTCWSIDMTQAPNGSDWGAYFYYGGPGGRVCD